MPPRRPNADTTTCSFNRDLLRARAEMVSRPPLLEAMQRVTQISILPMSASFHSPVQSVTLRTSGEGFLLPRGLWEGGFPEVLPPNKLSGKKGVATRVFPSVSQTTMPPRITCFPYKTPKKTHPRPVHFDLNHGSEFKNSQDQHFFTCLRPWLPAIVVSYSQRCKDKGARIPLNRGPIISLFLVLSITFLPAER